MTEETAAVRGPVIAVGSGKGGVGKSVLSIGIAAAFARRSMRVLLVDGAQHNSHLHVMLGIRPSTGTERVLTHGADPAAFLVPVTDGLTLLPIDSGAGPILRMSPTDRARMHLRLTPVFDRFDAVVIDAGPGIEGPMLALMRATRLAVVVVPEPASLSDAYALIKTASLRSPGLPIDVIANRTLDDREGEAAFARCDLASRRFLRRGLRFLGSVGEDPGMRAAVRAPGRLLTHAGPPGIAAVASALLAGADEPAAGLLPAGAAGGAR